MDMTCYHVQLHSHSCSNSVAVICSLLWLIVIHFLWGSSFTNTHPGINHKSWMNGNHPSLPYRHQWVQQQLLQQQDDKNSWFSKNMKATPLHQSTGCWGIYWSGGEVLVCSFKIPAVHCFLAESQQLWIVCYIARFHGYNWKWQCNDNDNSSLSLTALEIIKLWQKSHKYTVISHLPRKHTATVHNL